MSALDHFENDAVQYTEAEIAVVLRQVIAGVAHGHDRRIIHRDLKPDNILAANDTKIGEPDGLKNGAIFKAKVGSSERNSALKS